MLRVVSRGVWRAAGVLVSHLEKHHGETGDGRQAWAPAVGEATAGGAHPGSPYRIHPHFEVFIPNGRAINPLTKENWEGTGVQPDVPTSSEDALKTAYKLALEGQIERLGQPDSGPPKA